MKTITIRTLNKELNTYIIFLGSGKVHKFKSKRTAKRFLADTNRFLTRVSVELNDMYVHCFKEYRNVWFLCLNINSGRRSNNLDKEQTIKNNLHAVEELMDKVGGNHFPDAYMTFILLKKIALFMIDAFRVMIKLNKQRNNTITWHMLTAYEDRLLRLVEDIDKYGIPIPPDAIDKIKNPV